MKVEIVGFNCGRVEAIKAYRGIVEPKAPLLQAKIIIDGIARGHSMPLDLNDTVAKSLLAAGFELEFPTQKEIKVLMNQLIKRFLMMGKKKYANQIIEMWINIQKEEGNV